MIKNKDKSNKYFKDKVATLKLYDILIMSIICSWKKHDHEAGSPVIDYVTLKEINGVIKKEDDGKQKYINPINAEFMRKFFEKVQAFVSENIQKLTLEDMKSQTIQKSFKNFVDLTGRVLEHQSKLQNQGKASNKNRAIRPSGKQSRLNRKTDFEDHGSFQTLTKPAFIN